jgi:drug/metabolite transporter (DMT)-like permease
MTGEIAAVLCAVVWSGTSLMLKPISARFNPLFANCVRAAASAIIYLPFVALTGSLGTITETPLSSLLITISGTIVTFAIAESFFLIGIRDVSLSQVYPISVCGYPVVTLFLAYFFLGERLMPLALAGVALVLFGLYLTAFPGKGFLPRLALVSPKEKRGLVFTLLSVFFYGVGIILSTYGIRGMNLDLANFIRFTGLAVILLPFTYRHWADALVRKRDIKTFALAVGNGIIAVGIAGRIFLYALSQSGAALTSVLTSTSPLFLLPMSVFVLKEKITRKLAIGVAISVAGVCLVFVPGLLG